MGTGTGPEGAGCGRRLRGSKLAGTSGDEGGEGNSGDEGEHPGASSGAGADTGASSGVQYISSYTTSIPSGT